MQIRQINDWQWIIEGETITADSEEDAIKKYWIVRSQT